MPNMSYKFLLTPRIDLRYTRQTAISIFIFCTTCTGEINRKQNIVLIQEVEHTFVLPGIKSDKCLVYGMHILCTFWLVDMVLSVALESKQEHVIMYCPLRIHMKYHQALPCICPCLETNISEICLFLVTKGLDRPQGTSYGKLESPWAKLLPHGKCSKNPCTIVVEKKQNVLFPYVILYVNF